MKTYPTIEQTVVALIALKEELKARGGLDTEAEKSASFIMRVRDFGEYNEVVRAFENALAQAASFAGLQGVKACIDVIFTTGIQIGFLAGRVPAETEALAEVIPAIEQPAQSGIAY